jgi:thiol-disulfide isomerase/thioredoxin
VRGALLSVVALVLGTACASGAGAPGAVPAPVATSSASSAFSFSPATPDQIHAAIVAPGAQLTVVNVWATWCEPCVREMPAILQVSREARPRGVRTVLVSVDFESERTAAQEFLVKAGADFPTFVKIGDDQSFIDRMSKSWSGSIPVTFIFDPQGNLRFFREGDIDHDGLTAAIDAVLEPS